MTLSDRLSRISIDGSLLLPGGILALILLMVVPIPALLLDIFFVANIMLSVAILMAAMNARRPLDFSSFPTVLLFATLLRLALNVASTRVVLVSGHEGTDAAGKVIEAFGAFLIGGNFAVGLFVFAILMIINLMVVTKGAGRVSEVSARFTLDALPGKQMAIDADLGAGLITPDEARARRREVSTEADFYGSMDGASKFVKGDAVASVLILAVNIVAGFCLGMISHGLSAADAAQIYVSLAIGDALVAQVPSLLLSIAAAVIVTRVTSSEDLAGQIGGQFAHASTWAPVALVLAAIGMIPAMPQIILLPGAALAGYGAWRLKQREDERQRVAAIEPPAAVRSPDAIDLDEVSDHTLVTIELGYGLVHLVNARNGAPLLTRLTGVRKQLSQSLGFVVPQFRVRDSLDVEPNSYRILIGGSEVGTAAIRGDRLLALDTGEAVAEPELSGLPTTDPSFGLPGLWIDPAAREIAQAQGFLVVDASTVVATHLNQLVASRPEELLGPDEVQALVGALRERATSLVETVTPQPLSLAALTRVLRALLADGLSIGHLRPIFASLSATVQQTLDHARLVDQLRIDLGPMLVGKLCSPGEKLAVVTLDGRLEALIARGLSDPQTGAPLVEPDLARSIVGEIEALTQSPAFASRPVALIVQSPLRRTMAGLLRHRVTGCTVLALPELPAGQPIEMVAVIGGEPVPSHSLPGPDAAGDPRNQNLESLAA